MDNHCVPNFEMDEDYNHHLISTTRANKKSSSSSSVMADEDEFMELLWQNGQVVVQSQRSGRKPQETPPPPPPVIIPNAGEIRSAAPQHLFMQEDEMASWLHSPLDIETSFDRDIYADLLYPTISTPAPSREVRTSTPETRQHPPSPAPLVVVVPRPPVSPASTQFQNFMHFARVPKTAAMVESGPSSSIKAVVDSNETPMVGPIMSKVSIATKLRRGSLSGNEAAGTSTAAKELTTTCEITVTSSPEGSGASISAEKQPPTTVEDRKRKGREPDDSEGHSMELELESGEAKKPSRGATSTKRSRAAEVHNLSERRRRDRINEKMKALQELIPRCNKSDKASMLDEAIEYLKALQMQVQMMSMGCTMVPMMYPGVPQYMPAMSMGMGMGMGMGMDMGMNRPMVPYPSSAIPNPNPAAAAHVGPPRFPMPVFHMPPLPIPDPSRIQTSNTSDPTINTHVSQNPNQPPHANFVDPYQQYLSLHHGQVPLPQNQPCSEKPSSSREVGNPENHQSVPGG